MSWAAHEFENYFIQKHVGLKASFLAIVLGAHVTDLFTKPFVYRANPEDAAQFHRGWPGVGWSHSLAFGVFVALVLLLVTKSRGWALGVLIGQWAHVLTDIGDSAGVMPFFPFSTEPVTISMWKHAASEGRWGDAEAYYSSLGGVWDFFWFVVVVTFAWKVLRRDYFQSVIVPADPKVWGFFRDKLRLDEGGQLLLYRGWMFYGLGRMVAWFLHTRFDADRPFSLQWNGPEWVVGNDLSDAGFIEVVVRTSIGGVLFVASCYLLWRVVGRRLWARAEPTPALVRSQSGSVALPTR